MINLNPMTFIFSPVPSLAYTGIYQIYIHIYIYCAKSKAYTCSINAIITNPVNACLSFGTWLKCCKAVFWWLSCGIYMGIKNWVWCNSGFAVYNRTGWKLRHLAKFSYMNFFYVIIPVMFQIRFIEWKIMICISKACGLSSVPLGSLLIPVPPSRKILGHRLRSQVVHVFVTRWHQATAWPLFGFT